MCIDVKYIYTHRSGLGVFKVIKLIFLIWKLVSELFFVGYIVTEVYYPRIHFKRDFKRDHENNELFRVSFCLVLRTQARFSLRFFLHFLYLFLNYFLALQKKTEANSKTVDFVKSVLCSERPLSPSHSMTSSNTNIIRRHWSRWSRSYLVKLYRLTLLWDTKLSQARLESGNRPN